MFNSQMRLYQAGLLALVGMVISGCFVYSFSPGGKSSIKTIAVTQFENKTIEAGLSGRMTELVVDAFIADGNLKIASPEQADAVLSGSMSSYERRPKNYDENDIVTQYAVIIVFDLSLTEKGGEKEIWKERFSSEGIYSVENETEEDGQSRAAERLVLDIINRTTKSW
ncbi:MAG: LptE family protein [Candidatus Zixiibacteriota bacterium]